MYHVRKSSELNFLVFSMSKGESIIFVYSQSLKIRCANDFSLMRNLQIFDFDNHGTKSNKRLTIRLFEMKGFSFSSSLGKKIFCVNGFV